MVCSITYKSYTVEQETCYRPCISLVFINVPLLSCLFVYLFYMKVWQEYIYDRETDFKVKYFRTKGKSLVYFTNEKMSWKGLERFKKVWYWDISIIIVV